MPVTARLSKKFYDTLGEDIAQDLVDWFKQVDATYRGDLKELNELNFARFDAKLEQRMTSVEAKLDRQIAEVRGEITGLDDRLTALFAQANYRMEAGTRQPTRRTHQVDVHLRGRDRRRHHRRHDSAHRLAALARLTTLTPTRPARHARLLPPEAVVATTDSAE
jgi:hypothetical protein